MISMIAAMAHNSAIDKEKPMIIGNNNAMPWHLPADFAWFKQHTLGKPVIMGRKTFESIGKALPDRLNIVITRDASFRADGVTVVSSPSLALDAAKGHDEIMVIGGGSIYEAFLDKADKLYLTFIDADVEGDTQFPQWSSDFKETYSETYQADEKNAYNMCFTILEKQ
ncbi:type 3 dihydrofolate reductase [Vibrio parahaemolyticus]|uniref:type 3 dihydrofolate reductase n=3 Tax=Vibrio parahaemolyticus TaxID=670 RepID=UPI000817D90A|nr:type 3 dihydrofolate reductase [Vibrio parahaemolyticus]EKA4467470.1 type 3 dihydrofolate reductase [Vibrio parahaemolyticus]ELB2164306.1 type 3 dihydrofolate reductase [Vibrio parahaemolyticus]MCG6440862.1 type 3 dihydrofolate reductase [Vibrio parahaemolyticus]MCG6458495.1 type 3 dihydrofolate reductase [Vibrio parahaemolyticus]OCP62689.1 diacylglycerol kinase [Vibrio parahaemolyticus]